MPQLKHAQLDVDDCRHVVGVTALGDRRLYVLREPSKGKIEVYDTMLFQLQQTLNVSGLSDSMFNGLAACVGNCRLYVSDFLTSNVFNIQLSGDDQEISQWKVERSDVEACGNIGKRRE
jgi:hypothetical protein